jgi:hypothetical protein
MDAFCFKTILLIPIIRLLSFQEYHLQLSELASVEQ